MNEETKDCTRLPVVAIVEVGDPCPDTGVNDSLEIIPEDVALADGEELCRLTDAQARLAEKDARIAQLAAHARGKNKALANALEEIETLRMQLVACGVVAMCNTSESAAKDRDMHPDYMSASCQDVMRAVDSEMALRAQLEKLQSAPAERGAVLPALKVVEQAWGYDEGGNYAEGFAEGYNDAIDDVQRLNPAPATADSDVREVSE